MAAWGHKMQVRSARLLILPPPVALVWRPQALKVEQRETRPCLTELPSTCASLSFDHTSCKFDAPDD